MCKIVYIPLYILKAGRKVVDRCCLLKLLYNIVWATLISLESAYLILDRYLPFVCVS